MKRLLQKIVLRVRSIASFLGKGGDQLREALDAKLILETVKVFGTIPSRQRVGYAV